MKVKEICEYGIKSKVKAGEGLTEGKYKFFTSSAEANKFVNEYQFDKPGIIMGTGGNATLHYCDTPFSVSTDCIVLFPKDKLITKYLYYFFRGNFHILENGFKGAGLKHTSKKYINEIKIKKIPIQAKQEQIIDVLDNIEDIITRKKQQLLEYDQLIKSRFVEMFGDPESNTKKYPLVNLSDIAQYFNGLTYRPENVSDEGIIVLRSSNIQNSKLDFKDLVRVRLNVKENKMVRENDILMCSRNGSAKLVGKVALIDNLPERMAFGAFMMIIRSEYYAYLLSYFQMDAFRRQITTGATTTINQITSRMLDNVKLPLPEMNEVKDFELLVKQIDKLKFENEILYSISRFTINKQTKLLGYRGVTL
jgi:type I restriction enzyme S subunit